MSEVAVGFVITGTLIVFGIIYHCVDWRSRQQGELELKTHCQGKERASTKQLD